MTIPETQYCSDIDIYHQLAEIAESYLTIPINAKTNDVKLLMAVNPGDTYFQVPPDYHYK